MTNFYVQKLGHKKCTNERIRCVVKPTKHYNFIRLIISYLISPVSVFVQFSINFNATSTFFVQVVAFFCCIDCFGVFWWMGKQIVQKTFIGEGEKKAPNQVAGEILSFFTRNNFAVTDRGETITYVTVSFLYSACSCLLQIFLGTFLSINL